MEPALHELTSPMSTVRVKAPHVEEESNAPEPLAAEEPPKADAAVEQPKAGIAPKVTKPTAAELAAAKETIKSQHPGVDFESTPEMAKILHQLANKEAYIRALKAGKSSEEVPSEDAYQGEPTKLEELQRELYGTAELEAETVAPAADQPAPATNQPYRFNDIGDKWKGPEEATKEWNDAWAEGNTQKVIEIENAMYARRFQAHLLSQPVQDYIKQFSASITREEINKALGDVLPEIRSSITARQIEQDRQYSMSRLKKTEIGPEIDSMLTIAGDEQLSFDGDTFPDTPFNRIIIANPAILQIEGKGKTEADKRRDAMQKQLLTAHAIYKSQNKPQPGIDPAQAQALMAAGKTMGQREVQEQARQTINAGSGSTGLHSGTVEPSYASQLRSAPGELPLSALFEK